MLVMVRRKATIVGGDEGGGGGGGGAGRPLMASTSVGGMGVMKARLRRGGTDACGGGRRGDSGGS